MSHRIRVLYDWLGFKEPYGGVSRYFAEIIKRLPNDVLPRLAIEETLNKFLQVPPFSIPVARCSLNDFLPGKNFRGKRIVYETISRFMPERWPSYELCNDRASDAAIKEGDYDVLHLTSPHPVSNNWKRIVGQRPIVITVHDLIPEIMPQYSHNVCNIRHYRRQMLEDASHIIAVSGNTKSDIMRIYGIPDNKISVIYHGYSDTLSTSNSMFHGMKYILYVGKRGGYKNSDFFFKEMAPILRDDRSLNIVCTGGGFTEGEKVLFEREGISRQLHQKFVSDASMNALFADAACFVYPSLYEGFGIPILDAFAARCPVVLAKTSCFSEVAGDAAMYFEPCDGQGLRMAVRCAMGTMRSELINRGLKRKERFTWQKCAEHTANVYRKVFEL